ncbi:DUF892 family protein [Deinococcus sp. UYEF24]
MTLADLQLRPDEVRSLYVLHLQQIHSAEQQMIVALPSLAVNISTMEIKQRLLQNATQTSEHLIRLNSIFSELGAEPTGPVCEPMRALVTLSGKLTVDHQTGRVRDILLMAVAKEMKHLGIAKYPLAVRFAEVLGLRDQAQALAQSQQDEVKTDRDLTFFAENLRLAPAES